MGKLSLKYLLKGRDNRRSTLIYFSIGINNGISDWKQKRCLESKHLFFEFCGPDGACINVDKGQKVRLLYDLGKELHITYCGEGLFEVLVTDGKVLQPKDLIRFDRIGLSYPLFIEKLERGGKRLGVVVVGKVSGVTLIELMD